MKSTLLQIAFVAVLAAAGVHLVQVARQEQSQRVVSTNESQAQAIFMGLQPCDVPGVREQILSRGAHTIAYAGEFTPVPGIPWVAGQKRIYLYIVSGAGIARIAGQTQERRISAGDFIVIPQGARHAISALTPTMRAIYVEDGV